MIALALLAFSLATPLARTMPAVGAQIATAGGTSFEQLSQAAERARNENREDDAIRLYRKALSLRPEWQQGLWFLGVTLYEKEQYSAARDTFRRFMTLRPDTGPGWALLGLSEFQTREYPRALDHLQHAMASGLGNHNDLTQSVLYYMAVLLTRMERYDDSMDMLVKMISIDADPSLLVEPAGLAGLRLPLLPTEIPPDRKRLVDMAGQAIVAMSTQHYGEADAKFKEMEAAYPNEPGVHFVYGAYLMQLHPEDGIREMKRELEISPAHVLARVRLAEQYLAQQQPDQALQYAEQAAKLDPKRASAHMLLGEALVAKGELVAGTKELETSRDDDALSSRIHWDLMRAYLKAGRVEDAKREKEQIEKSSDHSPRSDATQDETSSAPAASK